MSADLGIKEFLSEKGVAVQVAPRMIEVPAAVTAMHVCTASISCLSVTPEASPVGTRCSKSSSRGSCKQLQVPAESASSSKPGKKQATGAAAANIF